MNGSLTDTSYGQYLLGMEDIEEGRTGQVTFILSAFIVHKWRNLGKILSSYKM